MKTNTLMLQVSLLVSFLIFPTLSFADNGYYHELTTERGAQQPVWIIERANAMATLILFAGGKGKLKISESGIGKLKNFLVRTRTMFADHGFNIVVMDKPRDVGDLWDLRIGEDHARDIHSVIKFVRQKYNKPVWLIGTSRGTLSVANAASRLHGANGPDGIVLTSSVLAGRSHTLWDVEMYRIKVPSLLIHNRSDTCRACPPDQIENIVAEMVKAKDKTLQMVEGGHSEQSNPCKALTPHGFLGLEKKVVTDIVNWIKPRVGKARGVAKRHVPATNL